MRTKMKFRFTKNHVDIITTTFKTHQGKEWNYLKIVAPFLSGWMGLVSKPNPICYNVADTVTKTVGRKRK